jgi:hypothetical protein
MKSPFTLSFAILGTLFFPAQLLTAQRLTAQSPGAPSPRSGFSLAFDSNRGVVVLFGGQDSANTRLGDTWEYKAGAWKKIQVEGPAARMNAPMTYDPRKKLICLFGGRTDSGVDNRLWTYDGQEWRKGPEGGGAIPVPRQLATMAYDKKQDDGIRRRA